MSDNSTYKQQIEPNAPKEGGGQIVLYQPDESISLEVNLDVDADTVWLMQAQMSTLFQRERSVIAKHIRSVFTEGELEEKSNVQILHNTLSKYKPTKIYN